MVTITARAFPNGLIEDNIRKHLPDTGWIGCYLNWTDGVETPVRYRFAVALGLISTTLNRRVWLPWENRGTYPNLWILLMGPSGCGKDSAINQGYELFTKLKMDLKPKVIAEKITPEALVKVLAAVRQHGNEMNRDCKGVVFAPELATFLGRARYNEGMIALLTRLYDCPSSMPTETVLRHNITLVDVCLNMLWGSTPDWYVRYMPDGAMCGGFMSRILYVFYPGREKIVANPMPFNREIEDMLLKDLAHIASLSGPMIMTKKAQKIYDEWYNSLPSPGSDSEYISGYISRKPVTAKKIAMSLAVSDTGGLIIDDVYMRQAIRIQAELEKDLVVEVPKMGATSAAVATDKLFHIISLKPGGMRRKEVMQRGYRYIEGKKDEFDRIIEWLLGMEKIERFQEGKIIFYRVKGGEEWSPETVEPPESVESAEVSSK